MIKVILIDIGLVVFFIVLFYFLSRIQMRAWLTEIEKVLNAKIVTINKKEDETEKK